MAKKDIKREAKETAIIIEDALRSIASRIGDIFSEALDETNTVAEAMAKDVTSSLNSLAKVSNELATSYQKAYEGAYKQADLQKTINQRKAKEFAIQAKIEAVTRNVNTTEEEREKLLKKLNAELEEAVGYNKDLESSLQKQVDISKNINKAMGLTGGALKGLKKLAGGIGLDNLEDVFADAESASLEMSKQVTKDGEEVAGLGGKIKVAWAGVSTAIGGIAEALTDPLFIIGAIIKSVKFLLSIFDHTLKVSRDVGQAFGVAGANAAKIKAEIHAAGDASGNMYYFTEELLEATTQLNAVAGQNLAFNEENAKTFQDLTLYTGLSAENVGSLYRLSLETGVPFQNMYDTVAGTAEELNKGTGFAMSTSDAIERISNASASVRFNIKGGTEGLVQAAHTAARLGTTMNEIAAAAESHLDFENSIGKEIEAEMFLQRDLNLEKLRMAALTGDTTTQAAEQERLIRENMGSLKGNVLAQQAFADALGISQESLAEQMQTLEKNKSLSEEEKQLELDKADAMAEQGQKAQTFDRAMQAAVKQLKAALEPLAKSIGPMFINMAESLGPMIKKAVEFLASPAGKVVMGVAGGLLAIKAASSLIGGVKNMFGGIMERGATPANPQFVYNVNESGGGMDFDFGSKGIKGNIFKYLGKKGGLTRTFQRGALKAFGKGKFGKILYNGIGKVGSTKIATAIGKPIGNVASRFISSSATNLTKNFGTNNMAKIAKMGIGGNTKAANMASKFMGPGLKTASAGLGTGTKVASGLAKTMKVLGPLGVAADLLVGGYTGSQQANMSAQEQKAAGVKVGIGKGEATALGVLTGGAEKGSMFSSTLGIEKGSAGDEALGIAGAAGRGALAGAAIGSVIPVVGTAVGAAVGGIVGTVSEGFKIFSDPNSSLRQGISSFASSAGETLTSAFNNSKDAVVNFASAAGETLSGWGASAKESISNFASKSMDSVKTLASGAKEVASNAYNYVKDSKFGKAVSSVGSTISSAASTAASYLNPFNYFANGGIVTRPTMGIIGEGGQSEAVIPLNRAGEFGLGGNQEVVALLKTLISEVRKGGNVYLDGNKVGYSLALQSSQMG